MLDQKKVKKGEQVMPMLTAKPFFSFFISNFPPFCQKGKSLVLSAEPFLIIVWAQMIEITIKK